MIQTKAAIMSSVYRRLPVFLSCLILLAAASIVAQAQIEQNSMILNGKLTVEPSGNAHFDATIKFNPPRIYDRVKRAYPNLYVLFRDMIANDRASTEIDRSATKISADDGSQTISFKTNILGMAVNRNGRWEIPLAKGETMVTCEGTKVITSLVSTTQNGMILNGTGIYALPSGAHNANIDKESHLLSYDLSIAGALKGKSTGEPQLSLAVRSRKNVMSALYKLYADSEAGNGRYWVAKAIVKNTGSAPMHNVKVTYNLGEYADTFTSRAYGVINPNGTVVDCYYPLFSSKVAQLKTRTPMQLSVKVEYKDSAGRTHTEDRSERLSLLGINQFQFSDLSEQERTDSWFDTNNNAPLLAAYVTKIDDPIKQLAGYISEAAGGAGAAFKPEDGLKWLEAAYNTELLNNIVYQSPSSGVGGNGEFEQDIKYPRDVLRAKSGTCIDLAILYASLAESVGMRSFLMLVPGHCFCVVQVGGQYVPVENTGLGGGNNRMSFGQAVQVAQKEMQEHLEDGRFYLIDIDAQQGVGHISNPELPTLESNFLTTCGISRTGVINVVRPAPNGGGNGRAARPEVAGGNGNAGPVGDATNFGGVWKGDMDGTPMTMLLEQSDNDLAGTIIVNGNATVQGTFSKVTVNSDNTVRIRFRASGGGKTYSVTFVGKRDGNTMNGTGTIVLLGPLNVPLSTRRVTWAAHYAGVR